MTRSKPLMVAAGVVLLAAVAAGGTQLALAERGDPTIVESFAELEDPAVAARVEAQSEPAVSMGNGQRAIASVQIKAAWADAITKVPGPLAGDDVFPEVETVDPAGGEEALYEDTMFEYIALNVWRCSWIGDEFRNGADGADGADIDRLREIDRTLLDLDLKAAKQMMTDLDEWHGGRHASGTSSISDYQEELSGASCQSFGLGQS